MSGKGFMHFMTAATFADTQRHWLEFGKRFNIWIQILIRGCLLDYPCSLLLSESPPSPAPHECSSRP